MPRHTFPHEQDRSTRCVYRVCCTYRPEVTRAVCCMPPGVIIRVSPFSSQKKEPQPNPCRVCLCYGVCGDSALSPAAAPARASMTTTRAVRLFCYTVCADASPHDGPHRGGLGVYQGFLGGDVRSGLSSGSMPSSTSPLTPRARASATIRAPASPGPPHVPAGQWCSCQSPPTHPTSPGSVLMVSQD